jgi:NADH dehydrogenase FAD-containing subunit
MIPESNRQNVVVVGGGGAGAPAVKHLSATLDPSKYNLILINSRPYFTHLVATIRMVVTSEGNLEDRALIPYDRNFVNGNGELVVGTVVSITDHGKTGGYVTLSNGETIEYSVLVLTPGSTWEGPLHLPDTKAENQVWVNDWRAKFEKSNDILLVGGGAVGIG